MRKGMTEVNWTPAEDDILIYMRRSGAKRPEIAKKLGRSIPSVQGRIQRLNLAAEERGITKRRSGICSERCATCAYRMWVYGQWGCNFGEIKGRSRSRICTKTNVHRHQEVTLAHHLAIHKGTIAHINLAACTLDDAVDSTLVIIYA